MNKLWPLLRKTRIHPLTWVFFALAILTARFMEVLILLGIVLIHELGHAIAAHYFDWRIKRVTILPFGGEMETDEHGNRPWKEELMVTIAGPIQHIWLFGLAMALYAYGLLPESLYHIWLIYNTVILLVNLIPIWPLDGGKLLFILLCRMFPFIRAHRLMVLSSVFILFIALLGLLLINPLNFNWWFIIGFLAFSLWREWKHRQYVFMRFLMARHYGHNSNIKGICSLEAEKDMKIYKVLENFKKNNKHIIVVKNKDIELGKLDETEILHACFASKLAYRPVGELLYPY